MLRKLPVAFGNLISNPPKLLGPPSRSFTSTRVLHKMSEFFAPTVVDQQPAGRAWHASELRTKSFNDLHCLWFICLKERNFLLSERLYFRQMQQAAPEGGRLHKVKKTLAAIKVVIGERARAEKAMEADKARGLVVKALEEAMSGRAVGEGGRDAAASPPDSLLPRTLADMRARASRAKKEQLQKVCVPPNFGALPPHSCTNHVLIPHPPTPSPPADTRYS